MQWFEKEEFWLNYGPIMFEDSRWAEAPDVAEHIVEIAHLKPGNKILDAGCGPGRISIELALLGMDVTGVDIIQPFLDAAKESADDEGLKLTLINQDLRTFKSKEKFDACSYMYTSFGYCDKEEEDVQILESIFHSLKDDGTFILECTSRESAIKYFTEGEWFDRAGKTVLTEFKVVGAWEGLSSKWILIDKQTGKRQEHCFVQRLYSAAELRKTLLKIGYKEVNVYGDFNYAPYDENLRTMILVARK